MKMIVRMILAVALVAVFSMAGTVQAGIFDKLRCKLQSMKCCEPACCESEPSCCEPEPSCCGEAVVEDCGCGGSTMMEGTVVEGTVVEGSTMEPTPASPSDEAPEAPKMEEEKAEKPADEKPADEKPADAVTPPAADGEVPGISG